MSLGAGAPRSGDATRAKAAGRRQRGLCVEPGVRRRRGMNVVYAWKQRK